MFNGRLLHSKTLWLLKNEREREKTRKRAVFNDVLGVFDKYLIFLIYRWHVISSYGRCYNDKFAVLQRFDGNSCFLWDEGLFVVR